MTLFKSEQHNKVYTVTTSCIQCKRIVRYNNVNFTKQKSEHQQQDLRLKTFNLKVVTTLELNGRTWTDYTSTYQSFNIVHMSKSTFHHVKKL